MAFKITYIFFHWPTAKEEANKWEDEYIMYEKKQNRVTKETEERKEK